MCKKKKGKLLATKYLAAKAMYNGNLSVEKVHTTIDSGINRLDFV
jgi:hypothetical protein